MTEAYCVKCRRKRKMIKEHKDRINHRQVMKGVCSKCGTKMNKFI